jgi:hypothetical protein
MDKSLSPDERADLVIAQMTLDEKIQLVHGTGWGVLRPGAGAAGGSNQGAGFVPGIERLGIPISIWRIPRWACACRRAGEPLFHAAAVNLGAGGQLGSGCRVTCMAR